MGLFTRKPYKLDSLNIAEKAAVSTALEIGLAVSRDPKLTKSLQAAQKDLRGGKMSKDTLGTTVACLVASLAALAGSDDPDRSSLLQQKKVVTVSMALALDKLKNML